MGLPRAEARLHDDFPPTASLLAEIERLKREVAVARARIGELDFGLQPGEVQHPLGPVDILRLVQATERKLLLRVQAMMYRRRVLAWHDDRDIANWRMFFIYKTRAQD